MQQCYKGSFPELVEACYRHWRNGQLSVSRNWGGLEAETKTIAYGNSACLLPDDLLLWKQEKEECAQNMIATWNVNSIRSRMEVLINWLESWTPDVL